MKAFLRFIPLCIIVILFRFHPTYAQQPDGLITVQTDSLAESIWQTNQPDSLRATDNSVAVEIMVRSQAEDLNTSVREKILQEQIDALKDNDVRQRRAMQQQLDDLRANDSLRRAKERRHIDSLKQYAVGAPVRLKSDTLYFIYTSFGSFTPDERAKLNSEKILKTAKIFSLKTDSLLIVQNNSTADIIYGDAIIVSVTETDALWEDTSVEELAESHRDRMLTSIAAYKKSVSILSVLKTIAFCILVVIGFYFSVKGVSYLFRRVIDKKLVSKKDKWFKGIRIKNLEIFNPQRQLKAVLFLSKIQRYILYVILLYLALLLLFGIFPPTQRLAGTLIGWVWGPFSSILKSIVNYLPNLFRIIVIIFVFRYIVKFCRYLANEISAGRLVIPGFYSDWATATFNIVRIFLYAFMIILIFPYLPDSESGVFQGVSVFVGAIFTLGSTSVIGNLMAGMVITYMRPFQLGDRIKIGDVIGDVVEKSLFVIRVKTPKNEIVTVPNSTVLSANVINYSATSKDDSGLIINTTIGMGYEVPWRQVNQLLIDAALKTEYILDNPQPFVLQTSLNDVSASYQLCAYTKNPEKQGDIYSQLHQNILDVFRDAGIEITTMQYQAIRDGNKSTVPDANI